MTDVQELLAFAEAAVDSVEEQFISGLGASPAHYKGPGDFATEMDLLIERQLRQTLTQFTGIGVLGEEDGGNQQLLETTAWVVDPIDGTANYSAGNPMCGILVALLHEARPVAAVASLPLLGRRVAAIESGEIRSVGGRPHGLGGAIHPDDEARGHVGCSSHITPDLFSAISRTGLRPRMTGSVGVDTTFVAQGVFDGAVNFSPYPWDNAAGALLVTAAGGVATDPEGNPWTVHSPGLICGTPQVHAALMDALAAHPQH